MSSFFILIHIHIHHLVGDMNRYTTVKLWAAAMLTVLDRERISLSFKKTGIFPFNRKAHLVGNRADVQIGDALKAADEMMRREELRERLRVRRRIPLDSDTPDVHPVDVSVTPTATICNDVQELRLTDIESICSVYGANDSNQPIATTYGLKKWPRHEPTCTNFRVWSACLKKSPQLMERFRRTDCLELKKFHNVGLLLDDEKDPQTLSAAQALILGYMYADAIDSISAPMVHAKLGDILSSGSSNQAELMVRYSKALARAGQQQMQHAEAAVALDLDPTSCNEVSLVQNFVDTMPKRSRGSHKRKISPNSATALFNKGNKIV